MCGRVDLLNRLMHILMAYGDKINSTILQTAIEAYLNAGMFQQAQEFANSAISKGGRIPCQTLICLERVLSGKAHWVVSRSYACKLRPDGSVCTTVRKSRKAKSAKDKVEDGKPNDKRS